MRMLRPLPPSCEAELMQRAGTLAGLSLGKLSERMEIRPGPSPERNKGWAGQLVEAALGADAGPLPVPDLRSLGVEIKTISVHPDGRPRSCTTVCHATTTPDLERGTWEQSVVHRKLARVLWVPLESSPRPLLQRRIGNPLLWSPSAEEDLLLRADWEELMELLGTGTETPISPALGRFLQLRPLLSRAETATAPRGTRYSFYLRPSFTGRLLQEHYR